MIPDPAPNIVFPDRRSGQERRKRSLPRLGDLLVYRRRGQVRRAADKSRIHVLDIYHPSLFISILLILFLSIIDGMLTLYLIERGATELNPVMDLFLQISPWAFVGAKYALTSLSLIALLAAQHTVLKRLNIRVRLLFPGFIVIFSGVILWELFLIVFIAA